ncbi:GGDEF domain-containing protein [Acidisoma cellulosilytica]|uniref:diguanylate cyclase n=1 Tax=Acidisoma cellulosilyticum TaxID=2802395 RepID=A0A963Z1L0_9PROT|nr:sensor domain-containing diguanylate cyclase [Acidisoma cellulosilyticum]MCB8880317.1 GGDEF domain-containing protein [Acidisoma cellulosilyticum]
MPLAGDAFDSFTQLGLLRDLSGFAPKILDLLPIGLQIDNLEHHTLYVNRSFTALFGYGLKDIEYNDLWFEVVYPDPVYRAKVRAIWEERVLTAAEFDTSSDGYERTVRCKDGSDKVVEFHIRRVGDYFVYLYIDVSSRHALAGELQRLAHTDELTGLANSRCFFEIGSALMRGDRLPLSLLTFDIDHFKAVNDGHGHAAGDQVLVAVAACCRRILAEGQTLARLGGEEFGILLPGYDKRQAQAIAERLRRAVAEEPIPLAVEPLHITISIGGACDRQQSGGLDALLLRADRALYAAKRAGRDQVCFAES